ncbi:MAG: TIGR04086 family membrane protein [Ruminococcus sp.]|nr:TIGR04086 family membrane protein [Ruminococcus sp.]
MRSRKRLGRAASNALTLLISAMCGFIVVFLCIMLFSFVMTKIDVSESVLSLLTSVGLCVGAYVGGFAASKRRRQNGLLMGLLCGLFMFGIIFLLSYIFAGTAGGFSASAKLVMTLVCASAGGVVGVNSKDGRFGNFKIR